jgi:asparagine synthase (glutamine-hydrolysing)
VCGFAGFLSASSSISSSGWPALLGQMGDAIRHRGPDDSGVWFDEDTGIGLSHRRLSIVDLSAAGHQPMQASSGRYVIAFNGEIYNHETIRRELENTGHGQAWRGHSDTETLLAGFDAWGIEDTIKKSIGMFAIALWDKHDRTLTLVRDRLGEKPLYYGWQDDTFLFCSELKALKVHPAFRASIDRNALALMMHHNCIPAPYSIYQGIQKLLPGSLLTVSLQNRNAQLLKYWDARTVVADGLANPFKGTAEDSVDALDKLLGDAVGQQMMADVPLGAFLSGGIDSSTIVALMQAQSSRPVRTFTIGFNEAGYNEAVHAKAVAKHLGTDHTELYVTSQQALDVIPRLPSLYCEPFSDSSQIPTFLVSQLARQDVTVSLSGDGGDELFGGYKRYFKTSKLNKKLSFFPVGLNTTLPWIIKGITPQVWNSLFSPVRSLLQRCNKSADIGFKLHLAADMLKARSYGEVELYHFMVQHWPRASELVLGASEVPTVFSEPNLQPKTDDFFHKMMALDMLAYLPDDILTKVDRAAMGVSLETRVPLLDHRVVEFAWSVPLDYKMRGGEGKWLLRQVLHKYIPKELMDRPKMGFGIPIDMWLRGPLRDWSEELLSESRLRDGGYFNPLPIRQKWKEHISGIRNWEYCLWDVLMFQAWLDEQ